MLFLLLSHPFFPHKLQSYTNSWYTHTLTLTYSKGQLITTTLSTTTPKQGTKKKRDVGAAAAVTAMRQGQEEEEEEEEEEVGQKSKAGKGGRRKGDI